MTIAALTVRHDLDISTEIIFIKMEVKIKELADVFVDFLQFCIQITWNSGDFFCQECQALHRFLHMLNEVVASQHDHSRRLLEQTMLCTREVIESPKIVTFSLFR